MHQLIASLLVGIYVVNPPLNSAAIQTPQQPRIKACSLLSRELMVKVSGPLNKVILDIPPSEEPAGQKGSACDYANVHLQVDPFANDNLRKAPAKDWQPLSGVGDAAFFHNNRDRYAELIVWTGSHHFTIQMDVPDGSTAEKTKPNTIALANAIIPKLK